MTTPLAINEDLNFYCRSPRIDDRLAQWVAFWIPSTGVRFQSSPNWCRHRHRSVLDLFAHQVCLVPIIQAKCSNALPRISAPR